MEVLFGITPLSFIVNSTREITKSSILESDFRLDADEFVSCIGSAQSLILYNTTSVWDADGSTALQIASELREALKNGTLSAELSKFYGSPVCVAPNGTVTIAGLVTSSSSPLPVWVIVIIVVLGTLLLSSCCALLVFAVRRRKRRHAAESEAQEDQTDAETADSGIDDFGL